MSLHINKHIFTDQYFKRNTMRKVLLFLTLAAFSSAQDTEPPTISCPTNVTSNNYLDKTKFGTIDVRTDVGASSATVTWEDPIVTDNSGQVNVTSSPYVSGDSIPISSSSDQTIIFTATDSSGNTNTCELRISVKDKESPTCMVDPIVASVEKDENNITINFVITVRDNVQVSSISTEHNDISIGGTGKIYTVDSMFKEINSTGTFPLGVTEVMFTIFDTVSPSGNWGDCLLQVTINEFSPTTFKMTTPTFGITTSTPFKPTPGMESTTSARFRTSPVVDSTGVKEPALTTEINAGHQYRSSTSTAVIMFALCSFIIRIE